MPKRKVSRTANDFTAPTGGAGTGRRTMVKVIGSVLLAGMIAILLAGRLLSNYGQEIVALEGSHPPPASVSPADPAGAGVAIDDSVFNFVDNLQQRGVPFKDEKTAIGMARALCVWFSQTGESMEQAAVQLVNEDPDLDMGQSKDFVDIATVTFCPQSTGP